MAGQLDNVSFTPTLGGTTDWTYSSTISGYQSPVAANATTTLVYECFAKDTSGNWEIARGACTITGGIPTFARTTVLYNSAGTGTMTPGQSGAGTKINFAAAPAVSVVLIKESHIAIDEANSFTAAQQAQALSNIGGASAGFVNKFRNGGMDVDQRGSNASPITVTTVGAYTVDGFIVVPTGASCVAQQITSNTIAAYSINSLQVKGATSVTDILVKQRIESTMAAPLAGRTVTVQAKIYNNTGGSITPTLTVKHATAQDNWGATATDVSAVSLQACPNASTTTVAYTFSASASSNLGLEVTIDLGNNFSTTGKTCLLTDWDIRVTPGIATGLNSAPPVPELRPIASELALCQRYYFRRNSAGSNDILAILQAWSTTQVFGAIAVFPTQMRAVPVTTISNVSHFSLANATGSALSAMTTLTNFNGNSVNQIATQSAAASGAVLVAGNASLLQFNTASGWIDASAEL